MISVPFLVIVLNINSSKGKLQLNGFLLLYYIIKDLRDIGTSWKGGFEFVGMEEEQV